METSSIGGEIHRFFSLRYPKQPLASRPSPSAFIHQRAKLNDHFFLTLLNRFNERFPLSKTKFGLHLLACDGTDLNIPADEDPDTFISYNSKDGGYLSEEPVLPLSYQKPHWSTFSLSPSR